MGLVLHIKLRMTSCPSPVSSFKITSTPSKKRSWNPGSKPYSFPTKCVWIFDDKAFAEIRKSWGFNCAWKKYRRSYGFSRRKPPLSGLRSKSKSAALTSPYEGNNSDFKECQNGKVIPQTPKNTLEVSQFYSFY